MSNDYYPGHKAGSWMKPSTFVWCFVSLLKMHNHLYLDSVFPWNVSELIKFENTMQSKPFTSVHIFVMEHVGTKLKLKINKKDESHSIDMCYCVNIEPI